MFAWLVVACSPLAQTDIMEAQDLILWEGGFHTSRAAKHVANSPGRSTRPKASFPGPDERLGPRASIVCFQLIMICDRFSDTAEGVATDALEVNLANPALHQIQS